MGNVGAKVFGALPIVGSKSQDILASDALISFLNLSLASPQLQCNTKSLKYFLKYKSTSTSSKMSSANSLSSWHHLTKIWNFLGLWWQDDNRDDSICWWRPWDGVKKLQRNVRVQLNICLIYLFPVLYFPSCFRVAAVISTTMDEDMPDE